MAEYVCAWCGKRFLSEKWVRYCSDECRILHKKASDKRRSANRRKEKREDGKYERVCINCGNVFLANDYRERICSEKCRRERKGVMETRRGERAPVLNHESTITEILLEGRREGLSYGKMMARREQNG